MEWNDLLNKEMNYVYKVTFRLIDLVDEDKLNWKPESGENWMTMGQLLKHITESCGMCFKGFVTGDWGMPEDFKMEDMKPEEMLPKAEDMATVESVKEAKDMLEKDRQLAIEMLEKCNKENFEEESQAPWEPEPKTLGEHLLMMIGHLSHHKAQLFYYLKLQGKKVNTHNLW